ncbi:hypothetical protein M3Y98_00628100 [Aphelenchoides besseyi]|nr:hypothetical protein M3Y98_00628100 [Aphelenchoides besseyi]KAI6208448.1 hypothetical protein M3Y96_00116400 [Aphelenchoides besseyi]
MKFAILLCLFAFISAATVEAGFFDDAKSWLSDAADKTVDLAGKAKEKVVETATNVGNWAETNGEKAVVFARNVTLDDIVNGAKVAGEKVGEVASDVYAKVTSGNDERTTPLPVIDEDN